MRSPRTVLGTAWCAGRSVRVEICSAVWGGGRHRTVVGRACAGVLGDAPGVESLHAGRFRSIERLAR